MSKNILNREIKTTGFVLKRTNYGEADRILNIITPLGKITAIAKGVRKEKSKLAGGIEMFSLIDFNIHKGKSEFGIVTGARMRNYYSQIVKDFNKLEMAGMILKKISVAADSSDNPDYFKIVEQCLYEIDAGMNLDLIESWFLLNLKRAVGDEINFYRDLNGERLLAGKNYSWDRMAEAFYIEKNGEFGENEIKMLRLMLGMDLKNIKRIKIDEEMTKKTLNIAKVIFGL